MSDVTTRPSPFIEKENRLISLNGLFVSLLLIIFIGGATWYLQVAERDNRISDLQVQVHNLERLDTPNVSPPLPSSPTGICAPGILPDSKCLMPKQPAEGFTPPVGKPPASAPAVLPPTVPPVNPNDSCTTESPGGSAPFS